VINPFRGLGFDQIRSSAVLMPDESSEDAVICALTESRTFSGATATAGFITAIPPLYNNAGMIAIYTGGDPATAASSPTAADWTGGAPESALYTSLVGSTGKIRLVGSGLKVNCISSGDSVAGTLEGGEWSGHLYGTDASHYTTYAEATTSLASGTFAVQEGITVHGKILEGNRVFTAVPTAAYGSTSGEHYRSYGSRPLVRFSGMSADPATVLSVQCVWYVEVLVNRKACPLNISTRVLEVEFEQMRRWANEQAFVTTGHSFKSFFAGIGKAAKQVFKVVNSNPLLKLAAKTVFTL